MGSGRWSSTDWNTYSSSTIGSKPAAAVFTAAGMDLEFDPKLIQFRESRDSADNPASTPVVLACDVTGSLGVVADTLVRGGGLDTLATGIQTDRPIPDPHVAVMAVGDSNYDRAPLQVTQFEADIRIAQQTQRLWIEKGGGVNRGESYALAYLFAASKMVSDSWDKRRRKGYVVTIGDEPPIDVSQAHAKSFLGVDIAKDMTTAEACALASERWNVFHVLLGQEGYCRTNRADAVAAWNRQMPGRVVVLDDVSKLAETVVSLIKVTEGASASAASSAWSGDTALVVASALSSLTPVSGARGVSRLV